jgi:hypothetical protein
MTDEVTTGALVVSQLRRVRNLLRLRPPPHVVRHALYDLAGSGSAPSPSLQDAFVSVCLRDDVFRRFEAGDYAHKLTHHLLGALLKDNAELSDLFADEAAHWEEMVTIGSSSDEDMEVGGCLPKEKPQNEPRESGPGGSDPGRTTTTTRTTTEPVPSLAGLVCRTLTLPDESTCTLRLNTDMLAAGTGLFLWPAGVRLAEW